MPQRSLRLLFAVALISSARASDPALETAPATPPPTAVAKETSAQYEARVHWLREARFGMFIHWGVYAVTSGEWKGKYYASGGEWIERIGGISVADYKALGKDFTASKYDPKAWADQEGALTGAITLAQPGPDAYLTDWTDSGWYLEYQVKVPAAGKWAVSAEVATETPVKLVLGVRDQKIPLDVPATGGKLSWKTVELGTLDLPSGESTIQLKPGKGDWKGGPSVRRFYLAPAEK